MASPIIIAYPELIDITNLSVTKIPSQTDCSITLVAPQCSISNAVYTWTNSLGNIIGTGPQITTDNSINYGNCTVSMTVPTAVTTNNSCSSNNPSVQAVTNVDICTLGCTLPSISPSGTIDFIVDCDNDASITVQTNVANCLWYMNGISTGATTPTILLGANSGPNNTSITDVLTVQNTLNGCFLHL